MKHKFTIFKLHFTSPLHLSNERDDYAQSLSTLHSDTLYAALTASLAKVGHQFDENFDGDLNCSISSLFPYYQENENANPVYFFPKSKKIDVLSQNIFDIHKKVKKITWLDKDCFEIHLSGKSLEKFYKEESIKNNFLSEKNFPADFINKQVAPHAQVPRKHFLNGEKQETDIYYMERLFFKDKSGMFFLTEGDTKLLEKALYVLQYEGIGTDRNVGNGYFEYKKDTIELNLPENANFSMNLSLFLPENKEQLKNFISEETAYGFKKRGGWVTTSPHNTIRKNRVYMFEEGSVFKNKINKPQVIGKIADLSPDLPSQMSIGHKIFRNGKSIFLPTNL